jgi:hypothetical protein
MTYRTCSLDTCDRKHVAKGYCGSHYNTHVLDPGKRHPKSATPCVVCDTPVQRPADSRRRTTCSVTCRTVVQWGQRLAQPSAYQWRYDVEKRARDNGCLIINTFDRVEVFDRDGWLCQMCGITCTEPDPYTLTSATVDHVIPLSKQGDHSLANTQTCCLSCNSSKADRKATTVAA